MLEESHYIQERASISDACGSIRVCGQDELNCVKSHVTPDFHLRELQSRRWNYTACDVLIVYSVSSNISFKTYVSLLIFGFDDLSIGASTVLKSPTIIVLLSISHYVILPRVNSLVVQGLGVSAPTPKAQGLICGQEQRFHKQFVMALKESKTNIQKQETKDEPQTNGSCKTRQIIIKIMEYTHIHP